MRFTPLPASSSSSPERPAEVTSPPPASLSFFFFFFFLPHSFLLRHCLMLLLLSVCLWPLLLLPVYLLAIFDGETTYGGSWLLPFPFSSPEITSFSPEITIEADQASSFSPESGELRSQIRYQIEAYPLYVNIPQSISINCMSWTSNLII